MNWLIWKEYRLNRLFLLFGGGALVIPYVVALGLASFGVGLEGISRGESPWAVNVGYANFLSVVFCQLVLGMLGGNAFAGERQDRSAEFLAYLPISRAKTVAAKAILALATTATIWIPNALIFLLVAVGPPDAARGVDVGGGDSYFLLAAFPLTGFMLFASGWLWSSFVTYSAWAMLAGLFTLYAIAMADLAVACLVGDGEISGWVYLGSCLVLPLPCLVAGTWYYLRRVEQ